MSQSYREYLDKTSSELDVKFQHFYDKWTWNVPEMRRVVATFCYVSRKEYPLPVGIGVSLCSDLDTPCKETGRKISFERAIKALETRNNTEPIQFESSFDILNKAKNLPVYPYFKSFCLPQSKDAKF